MTASDDIIRLTQFNTSGGCGCKIDSRELSRILKYSEDPDEKCNTSKKWEAGNLLVGYSNRDDAAVMNIEGETCVVSTTDFFQPIVDDPLIYGRIAAVNAISDIYAMGARPCMGISILGWPTDKLSAETAGLVIKGARMACSEAGMPLAGGHSIKLSEPVFGLAVTGVVSKSDVKMNGKHSTSDNDLFLTKPLGVGVLMTAARSGNLSEESYAKAIKSMTTLNNAGLELAKYPEVTSMTDVTGFGLAGHLIEMLESSEDKPRAVLYGSKLPHFGIGLINALSEGIRTGAAKRNEIACNGKYIIVGESSYLSECVKPMLVDPQTSGGLLLSVDKSKSAEVASVVAKTLCPLLGNEVPEDPTKLSIGKLVSKDELWHLYKTDVLFVVDMDL